MPPNLSNSPWVLQVCLDWLKTQPVVGVLITLMILDTMAGTFLALVKKTLNSTTSWRGACKKGLMLLIVGAGGIMQPLLPGIPIMNMMAMYYVITEAISLLENAGAAGVPLPAGLIDTLVKLREQKVAQLSQKGISQTTNVTVMNVPESAPVVVPADPITPPPSPKSATQPLVIVTKTSV